MFMERYGVVFDIERCSFHDGPGIRTTVFLKGCPLSCKWCHNPESQSFNSQILFNKEKCVNCQNCVHACSENNHIIINGNHVFLHKECSLCGECLKNCNHNALNLKGEKMSIDMVMKEVLSDKDYYKSSGGGLTISGGEPMSQFEFTLELLKNAMENGINTCMETCGFASKNGYDQIKEYVDLFLFDYKVSNPKSHKELTGVSNDIILENLDFLYNSDANIILRCPLIPGVNDNSEHFNGIADLSEKYPNLLGIEIMAYHNMGVSKGNMLGKSMELASIPNTDDETKEKWLQHLRSLGCKNIVIG